MTDHRTVAITIDPDPRGLPTVEVRAAIAQIESAMEDHPGALINVTIRTFGIGDGVARRLADQCRHAAWPVTIQRTDGTPVTTPASASGRPVYSEQTAEWQRLRGIILDTIASHCGQVAYLHPRLLEAIEHAATAIETTSDGTTALLIETTARLTAAERLRGDVEKILDRVLGTDEDDGAGAGLVADVELALAKARAAGAADAKTEPK